MVVPYKFKNSKIMKSVGKKQKQSSKSPVLRQNPTNPPAHIRTQLSIGQEEFRRYSEAPTQQGLPSPKLFNRQSRMTQVKSDHPNRLRSMTPGSQASSLYMTECQNRYKELEQIMKRQHENITQQNFFLQQQVRSLYQREARYKQSIRRYKDQIKFLRLQNQIYQQRYTEIKSYINSVVERMAQLTVIAEDEDKEMFRNSSLQMVAKLKEELSHYEDYNESEGQGQVQEGREVQKRDRFQAKNVQSQFFYDNHDYARIEEETQNLTNNFIHTEPEIRRIVDLQQTRFKDPKQNIAKPDQSNLKKKPHKHMTFLKNLDENVFSLQSELNSHTYDEQNYLIAYSSKEYSTPNSDQKTIDNNFKAKNLLQDTSESNCLPVISQQIDELTDQSEALMYELKKTNNQDSEIKKKIIRISQKIRELKIEANSMGYQQRFASLPDINLKQ